MNTAQTTPAPDALPIRAGHLGISYPRPARSNLGAYSALVELDPRDPACPSNARVPQSLCGDCCNHASVAVVEYGGETIGACGRCLPGLVKNGAEVVA